MNAQRIEQFETLARGANLFEQAVKAWYAKFELPRLQNLFDFDDGSLRFLGFRSSKDRIQVSLSLDKEQLESIGPFDPCYARTHKKQELIACMAEEKPLLDGLYRDWAYDDYVYEARGYVPDLRFLRGRLVGAFEKIHEYDQYVLVENRQRFVNLIQYRKDNVYCISGENREWFGAPDTGVIKRQMTVSAVGDRFSLTLPNSKEKAYFRKLNVDDLLHQSPMGDVHGEWRVIRGNEVGKDWPSH